MRRFELPTPWSVAKCSIQLSYMHTLLRNKMYSILLCGKCQVLFCGFHEAVRYGKCGGPESGRTRRESAVSGPSAREGLTKNMAADTIMDVSEQVLETINNKGQI